MKKLLKTVRILICAVITTSVISSCSVVVDNGPKKYSGPYSEVNGTYGGVDDLGRVLISDIEAGQAKKEKEDVYKRQRPVRRLSDDRQRRFHL